MSNFAGYHPIVLFVYYMLALVLTMFTSHPILLGASFCGAFLFYTLLTNVNVWTKDLVYYFFLFLLLALTNPLFSHNGATPLFFLNDQPVTLEAVWYGMAMGLMIVSILFWCKCYNFVLTTDKFIYLFGKTIPKLSLVISMALRFFPLLKEQVKKVSQAQKTMGMYAGESIVDRILFSIRMFDSVITWMLESSVDTADSMKARGYGLLGRSNFSIFSFEKRDGVLLSVLLILGTVVFGGWMLGAFEFAYYPKVTAMQAEGGSLLCDLVAIGLLVIPFVLEGKGKISWIVRCGKG